MQSARTMAATAWELSRAKQSTLLVLLAMADEANPEDRCFYLTEESRRNLVNRARVTPSTLRTAMRRLVDMGEILLIAWNDDHEVWRIELGR